jgi:2,3-bisphosphoglycerate-independent phosphoglycerate mutase
MKVVFLFIDGLGLAPAGENNPLATTRTPNLNRLLGGCDLTIEAAGYDGPLATLCALDATLGLPGCPQSATGQTTLFTGINAALAVGRHISGFPNEELRKILAGEGMLKKITAAGFKATFVNSYRPEFFEFTEYKTGLFSASTMLNLYAGLPFRTFEDMARGEAVYFDITNHVLPALGHDVPPVSPELAGQRVAAVAGDYDFTFFEHFLTDIVGHKRNREKAAETVATLDSFIGSLEQNLDLTQTLLVLTSDHGNLEDLTSRTHTRNPVPLLLAGAGRNGLSCPRDLTGVAPLVMDILNYRQK